MKITQADRKHFNALLAPSWLSGLAAVLAGLVLTVGVIIAFSVQNSSVQQQLLAWQQTQPQEPLTTPDEIVTASEKPTLQGSWPLIVVWSFVGLATYSIAASIMHGFSDAFALKRSLGYVHAKRGSILKSVAEHLILRIVAAGILAALIVLFIQRVIPYVISASHASAADLLSLEGVLFALLSFFVVTFTVHVQAIFLRLALGKIRIFSSY